MKIAFVAERLLIGFGVDLVIDQVASRLAAQGHDVTVYAASVDPRAHTGTYRVEQLPVAADRIYPRYEMRARRWASYIDAAEHDVVFVETFPFFSLIPVLRTPAVAVDHGISSTDGLSAARRAMFSYVRATQYRRYLPKAAGIVVVSEFLKQTMPPALRQRTRVIHNGADHYAPAPDGARGTVRAELGIGDDETMALYVGRLNPERQPYKGTADLIALAGRWRARGIRLVMAGRGEPEDAVRITAAGAIPVLDAPAERLAALYAAADVYVTASRWEGFDLPLSEAQAAGVPGVALKVGAHAEVLSDGETGILAHDIAGLAAGVERLAGHPATRDAMGAAAKDRASRLFRWDDAARVYAEIARDVAQPRTTDEHPRTEADITAVILNYGAELDVLDRCIASALTQTVPIEILLVDNGSPRHRDALDELARRYPTAKQLRLRKNLGFSGGINAGIAQVRTPYVLILNNDTEMRRDAAEHMRRVLRSDDTLAGVAPKIMFIADPDVFDAVGNLISVRGAAFNMGIGQIDIGQYDRVERTFGACFAATLIRTDLFHPGRVGSLDESYFMYYEDIDWCYRANLMGYAFATAPEAVVLHQHSYSVRSLEYAFKYRLIERNFVRTVIKNFERGRAIRAAIRRTIAQLVNAVTGRYPLQSIRVVLETLIALPVLLRERAHIQTRRRTPDATITGFALGERPCFDPERYAPERSVATIEMMYRRKYLVSGEAKYKEIADVAAELGRHRSGTDLARERLAPLLKDEPARVQTLVEELQAELPRAGL